MQGYKTSDGSYVLPDGTLICKRKYSVIKKLGIGASSIVYLIQENRSQNMMALKVFNKDYDRFRDIETDILNQLRDVKGVVRCLEKVTLENGMCAFVMPYYENGTLDVYLKTMSERGLNYNEHYFVYLLYTFSTIVFDYVRDGVCQCDLKPTNFLMRDDDVPVIADFGLAQKLPIGCFSSKTPDEIYTSWYKPPNNTSFQKSFTFSLPTEMWALLVSSLHLASITRRSETPESSEYYYRFLGCPMFQVFRQSDYDLPNSQKKIDNAVDSVFKEKKFSDFFKKWLNIVRMKDLMASFNEDSFETYIREFRSDIQVVLEILGDDGSAGRAGRAGRADH